jgi:uncharacterized membrane protein YidH (DUF202 family)
VARALLIRGMVAGLAGGLAASIFAFLVGEPAVGSAISFERQRLAAEGAAPYMELVSRDLQSTLGLATGVIVYGIALGGLFALVFALLYGRVREATPARTSAWLAAGAFVVVYLVPFLKYPANPPAVGQPETIGSRTALYLAMLLVSLAAAAYALWLYRRLDTRVGRDRAALLSAGAYVLVVVVAGLLLPGVNEVPSGFPATTLYNFRIASIGIQAITWTTVGLLFGFLAERALDPDRSARTGAVTAPTLPRR